MPRRTTGLLAAAVVALAGTLAACGGSGGSGGTSSSTSNVLKVWWYEGNGSAYQIAWDQAIKDFKKQHPGVTVQFSLKSFNQMQQNASMILNSSNVPDVMEYNKGDATTGLLSKQGLLTDLTSEATKYGWDKLLSPGLQVTARYSRQGRDGLRRLVRRLRLRRVPHRLLQQGHVREVRDAGAHHDGAADVGHGHVRQARRHPVRERGQRLHGHAVPVRDGAQPVHPAGRAELRAVHRRGQLPRRRLDQRGRHVPGLGAARATSPRTRSA